MKKETSIIIPVYNAEQYINLCLESILKQTYENYEIILINDGSTDKTEEILRNYEKLEPDKIKIIAQENKGIAQTRNLGIYVSKGEYIVFIDNDDEIDRDYLEVYVNKIKSGGLDMALGGYRIISEKGKILSEVKVKNKKWTLFKRIEPWGRIYKKSFLTNNNLQFLDTRYGEDAALNIPAIFYTNKFAIIDYQGYNWRKRMSSESNFTQKNLEKWREMIKTLEYIFDKISPCASQGENREFIEYFFVKFILRFLLHAGRKTGKKQIIPVYEQVFKFLEECFPNYLSNKNFSPFKPDGEYFEISLIVYGIIEARKLKLDKLLFALYSEI